MEEAEVILEEVFEVGLVISFDKIVVGIGIGR